MGGRTQQTGITAAQAWLETSPFHPNYSGSEELSANVHIMSKLMCIKNVLFTAEISVQAKTPSADCLLQVYIYWLSWLLYSPLSEISPPFPHLSKFGPVTLSHSHSLKSMKRRWNKSGRIRGGQEFHSSEHTDKWRHFNLLYSSIIYLNPSSPKQQTSQTTFPSAATLTVTHYSAAVEKLRELDDFK